MISILIIGNEILSAQVRDTNLPHMLRELSAAGYHIDEVRIVRDEMDPLVDAIRALSARSDYMISTGGIGPTHDDITLDAYARAFDEAVIQHPDLEAKLFEYFGKEATTAQLRMARVPANIELIPTSARQWPLLKVKNCFVLPGLPEIFLRKFERVMAWLPDPGALYYAELLTDRDESDFSESLAAIQNQFPSVEIGSYPNYDRSDFSARVTLKGRDLILMNECFTALKEIFEGLAGLIRHLPPAVYQPGGY